MTDSYIPKGKNIKTRHGCTCVNEFTTFQGEKKIKDACTLFDDDASTPTTFPFSVIVLVTFVLTKISAPFFFAWSAKNL